MPKPLLCQGRVNSLRLPCPLGTIRLVPCGQPGAAMLRWVLVVGFAMALASAEPAHAQTNAEAPDQSASLESDAFRLLGAGKKKEAEQVFKTILAIREYAFGPDSFPVAVTLSDLAELYESQARFGEAEANLLRSLAIRKKTRGPEHASVGFALNNLASLYREQGRYREAEPLVRSAIALLEKAGAQSDVAIALNNLAELHRAEGLYAEAEAVLKRSIDIREKEFDLEHPQVAFALNSLGAVYQDEGRFGEAEALFNRALAIVEKAYGTDDDAVATGLSNLASARRNQGRFSEAETLYERALAIVERNSGPDSREASQALNNLAGVYKESGDTAKAEELLLRSLGILEKVLGPDHPDVGTPLDNLASLYLAQRRLVEAEPICRRALAINRKALGAEHPSVATALDSLAWFSLAQRDFVGAADFWRQATTVIKRRSARSAVGAFERPWREAQRRSWYFEGLVKATDRLPKELKDSDQLAADMFETAQWGQGSDASASLALMAARSATGSPALTALVRERQDLVGEWQAKDKVLTAARGEASGQRNAEAERRLADRLIAIDARLTAIDADLAKDFPDYAALASPMPISVADVQASLHADEALVLLLDTIEFAPLPEETFVWVVTKTDVRWVRSELGGKALFDYVTALRCGLDAGAWTDDGLGKCNAALDREGKAPQPQSLPFDVAKAETLYRSLFGPVEDLIRGKHLLVVPSGPLRQLPFQVLVTGPSQDGAGVAWLARRHAITVLPSVASLKALRDRAHPSAAAKPYVAFANPLLKGRDKNSEDQTLALLAVEKRNCSPPRVRELLAIGKSFRMLGGEVDVSDLLRMAPVPQTADLVCDVADAVGAGEDDVHLGARATEAAVKALSDSGKLASYAVVNFATHGLVAGKLAPGAEPGLILTPDASTKEDGYLSASEVGQLKLDADWVILSACNTAAGGTTDATALSGLARMFFYAGARALLVSHWSVREDAAVALVTRSLATTAADRTVGRAEAVRRAMMVLADSSDPLASHPSYWAPFVVVGEGSPAATR